MLSELMEIHRENDEISNMKSYVPLVEDSIKNLENRADLSNTGDYALYLSKVKSCF
jgi:hypothetical protein